MEKKVSTGANETTAPIVSGEKNHFFVLSTEKQKVLCTMSFNVEKTNWLYISNQQVLCQDKRALYKIGFYRTVIMQQS